MKKLLLLLFVLLSFGACKKDDPTPNTTTDNTPVTNSCTPNTSTCIGCNEYYAQTYLDAYLDSVAGLKIMTLGFANTADPWMVDSAHSYAGYVAATVSCVSLGLTVLYDLSNHLLQLQSDACLTQAERDNYIALVNYISLVSPGASPGNILVQDCQ